MKMCLFESDNTEGTAMHELFQLLTIIAMVTIFTTAVFVVSGSLVILLEVVMNLSSFLMRKIEDKFREADDRRFLH